MLQIIINKQVMFQDWSGELWCLVMTGDRFRELHIEKMMVFFVKWDVITNACPNVNGGLV